MCDSPTAALHDLAIMATSSVCGKCAAGIHMHVLSVNLTLCSCYTANTVYDIHVFTSKMHIHDIMTFSCCKLYHSASCIYHTQVYLQIQNVNLF